MKIVGITAGQFAVVTERVSREDYFGNLRWAGDDLPYKRKRGCRVTLSVRDSHGPGSRTAWTGRHGPWACWHAFRDVLAAVFEQYPETVITAGHSWLVVYRGRAGFEAEYPRTGAINIGSRSQPAFMPQLCACMSNAFETEVIRAACAAQEAARERSGEAALYRHLSGAGPACGIDGITEPAGDLGSTHVSEAVRRAGVIHERAEQELAKWEHIDERVFGPQQ